MNIEQILEKQENAIIESGSQLLPSFTYWQKTKQDLEQYYYLKRSQTSLCHTPFKKDMTIITQLCERTCDKDKELQHIYDFVDVETMHKQLEFEQVCSYKYFRNHQTTFRVGTHQDIFDNLFFQRFNNATLIFEDAHDLPLKLEKAMSASISTHTISQMIKAFLVPQKTPSKWDQQMNTKLKFLSKQFQPNHTFQTCTLTQQHYDILMPIIAFCNRIVQFAQNINNQKDEFIFESNKIALIVTQCTQKIPDSEFFMQLQQYFVKSNGAFQQPKYTCIDSSNYEQYLDEIYNLPQRYLMQQWYIFIKQTFELQDSNELEIISQQQQQFNNQVVVPTNDKISVDKSIQAAEQQNHRDYKLVLFIDNIQNSFNLNLICLSPLCGMNKLQNNGVQNIVIITQHSYPAKLYKTEFNIHFQFYPQIPVQELKINQTIISQVQNYNIDYLNKTEQNFDAMILEIGKQFQQINYLLNGHGFITLFSSKSFMQKCQDIWSQHSILSSLGVNKEFQWIKYQNKKSIYEIIKLFLNKCRSNTIFGDTMPSIYTVFNDLFLDQLQEAIQIQLDYQLKHPQTLKNQSQITVFLLGVPWASQFMYYQENGHEQLPQLQLNLKLEWLKNQKNNYDRKYFSMVNAIRNISRLQHILDPLIPCNLVVLDEKFQQKLLWKDQQFPNVLTFPDLIKELKKQGTTLVRSEILGENRKDTQKIENNKGQTIKFNIKQPVQIQTSKRKIMLNKTLLGDIYNPQKKSLPVEQQCEKITIEQLIGQTDTKDNVHTTEEQLEIDNLNCVICWSNTPDKVMCKSEKCGHVACQDCWKQWLQTKLECPLCRARVREKFLIKFD
ncbi:unnamed protein product (macronuclear) [Paramecium tetraurelia]|uniref:RING-type domain-containing protein n=1 Tax=Paramecium tetraurelia TaxID=5888 RepID=A0E8J9_PARTE|nr:uncharacterized protein GSPATT00024345001 [Paramecium tetraurelia]CAK91616.1 unnamed protein product [Paramecium tetraurelia]|eukprot:XP_001459013.1 hypothetical protein (macronuclear) [Paramecium tetraurelia strain d4-2]